MKIIFDSEEQREKFFKNISNSLFCPSKVLLPIACKGSLGTDDCVKCWEKGIESEVKEQ